MENSTNEKIDELAAIVKENAATIEDLAIIVKAGFDHVGEEIASLRSEFKIEPKSEISAVRTELKSDIVGLRNEFHSEASSVRTEISSLRSEMCDGFMKTNDKVDLLAVKLSDKNVITRKDAKEVMVINPVTIS
jgi:hypothetical protein